MERPLRSVEWHVINRGAECPCLSVPESVSSQIGVAGRHRSSLLGLLAEALGGDSVHVHGTLLGESLAHGDGGTLLREVLGLANEASLLELLEAVADVLSGGLAGVLSLGAIAGLGSEVLAESVDANLVSHVELVADGGGAGVEPVIIERGELLVAGGLNGLGPLLNIIKLETR